MSDSLIRELKGLFDISDPKNSELRTKIEDRILREDAHFLPASLTLNGFDPALDTPIELLCTVLLGSVKYVWHTTHRLPLLAIMREREFGSTKANRTQGLLG